MRMEEIHRFPTPIIERGEHLFWDIDALWDELKLGFRKALDAAPDLRSVSVDSWAVDYVPLDAEGEPLRPPYCYRDPRTDGMMEQAFATLSPRTIYGRTGIQFLPFNTLFQLLADKRDDPDLLRRTHSHLLIADYFNYRFSGRQAVECTNASTTQFMKVGSPTWDDALFYAFDLDPAAWPEIVPAGTPLGPCLAKLGVTVVASCSHDTGSAVAAAPATGDDWAFVSCGTWSLLGAVREEPILTAAAREAGFTHEAGLDGTIRFLKNLTGLWALQECAREWGVTDWEALEAEATDATPSPAILDLEDARFLPRGDMEARIRAACREQGLSRPETRGEVARLILESIAASYRRALGDLERVTERTIRDAAPLRRWLAEPAALPTHRRRLRRPCRRRPCRGHGARQPSRSSPHDGGPPRRAHHFRRRPPVERPPRLSSDLRLTHAWNPRPTPPISSSSKTCGTTPSPTRSTPSSGSSTAPTSSAATGASRTRAAATPPPSSPRPTRSPARPSRCCG